MIDHLIAAFIAVCFMSLGVGIWIGLDRAMGDAGLLISIPVCVGIGYGGAAAISHVVYD